MTKNKKINPFVTFYGKHKISPVHQDISDFGIHLMRREKLYNSLGIPTMAFAGKRIVEVGPGGGYNTLAFFSWGAAHVDLIEPNKKAQDEVSDLFSSHKIDRKRWKLFPATIEEVRSASQYDIVIAEGFISGLYERDNVILKLKQLAAPKGIVVVTCIDDIGFLLELIKRIVGHYLIRCKGAETFDEKVALLSRAFQTHLKSLKFASRPVEDWVTDQFLNPSNYGKFFNIAECITEFGREFELLGSSPSMFVDHSWYKDIKFDRHNSILEQYAAKKHVLLWQGISDSSRPAASNDLLAKKAFEFRMICKKAENNLDDRNLKKITAKLREILVLVRDINKRAGERILEGIRLLEDKNLTEEKVSGSDKFASSFGRCQQYVSLIRKA